MQQKSAAPNAAEILQALLHRRLHLRAEMAAVIRQSQQAIASSLAALDAADRLLGTYVPVCDKSAVGYDAPDAPAGSDACPHLSRLATMSD